MLRAAEKYAEKLNRFLFNNKRNRPTTADHVGNNWETALWHFPYFEIKFSLIFLSSTKIIIIRRRISCVDEPLPVHLRPVIVVISPSVRWKIQARGESSSSSAGPAHGKKPASLSLFLLHSTGWARLPMSFNIPSHVMCVWPRRIFHSLLKRVFRGFSQLLYYILP